MRTPGSEAGLSVRACRLRPGGSAGGRLTECRPRFKSPSSPTRSRRPEIIKLLLIPGHESPGVSAATAAVNPGCRTLRLPGRSLPGPAVLSRTQAGRSGPTVTRHSDSVRRNAASGPVRRPGLTRPGRPSRPGLAGRRISVINPESSLTSHGESRALSAARPRPGLDHESEPQSGRPAPRRRGPVAPRGPVTSSIMIIGVGWRRNLGFRAWARREHRRAGPRLSRRRHPSRRPSETGMLARPVRPPARPTTGLAVNWNSIRGKWRVGSPVHRPSESPGKHGLRRQAVVIFPGSSRNFDSGADWLPGGESSERPGLREPRPWGVRVRPSLLRRHRSCRLSRNVTSKRLPRDVPSRPPPP